MRRILQNLCHFNKDELRDRQMYIFDLLYPIDAANYVVNAKKHN